ncbi:uncharacterized protein LOC126748908 [Anthonomus grandis grandis]|uniref:uncharacterized protein LOC126748908 n=1 Tax=Anthonomus grandis grandis TaxID=2921223 RepID=UPI002165EEA6|nr:uncharacterized protein LOC126748908 [Anthonomus grandis grandis]
MIENYEPSKESSESQPKSIATASGAVYKTPLRSRILQEVNVTRQVMLTPKARHLYKRVIKTSNKMIQLRSRMKSFQERLNEAKRVASQFDGLLEKVNKPTYNFIMSQIRTQKQKPKARRFTLDEKILCLSILKASGKGYRLLAKVFTLPSKTTLTNLLSKIRLSAGINSHLIKSLKEKVKKLKEVDRTAIIIFDEMSINMGLTYNQKDDCIYGFHDLGDNNRKALLSNYANVVMVKGVYKHWKQPLCFTFSNGPITTFELKSIIKKVIGTCQEAGLDVVATVCEGSANQAAIKNLIDESKVDFLRRNEEYRHFGFFVNGKEIVPLFDPPHLIKGIRDNLLTKDLHFIKDGVKRVAKWEHLEQFYMLDAEDEDQICSNLTDSHFQGQNQQNEGEMLYPSF